MLANLNYNDQLIVQVWVILHLADNEQFEPGAATFIGDANVVNFQLGTTTDVPGSPSVCGPGELIRFGESGPWRFLVTDLDSVTKTLLDHLASNCQVEFTLNAPCRMSGDVPSDNPEVNLGSEFGTQDPLLAEGTRLLYCFRRENDVASSGAPIWVIRAAGIILDIVDSGGPDSPVSSYTAWDPWQLLYRRPLRDGAGELPGENGLNFSAAGSLIAEQIIAFSELVDGPTHLDLLTGVIETTEVVDITFQQGISVGEAIDQLVATGTMDIIIEPVYDPVTYPGIVGTLNIFSQAGTERYAATFAWDKPGRSAVRLDREINGRERANALQYYIGQGGRLSRSSTSRRRRRSTAPTSSSSSSPGRRSRTSSEQFARKQGSLRARGLITYEVSPAPERSPVPITDYYIGDFVPIYASNALREQVATLKRVYSIPLVIGNDQQEAPANIVVADLEVFE